MRRRLLGQVAGGDAPVVPTTDLSFWYEFDNASKITEDGTNIQEILSSETNAWSAVPLTNDPLYSSAGGYSQYVFGSSMGMQSIGMRASGYPISVLGITSGFLMMVVEFDAIVNNRWIGGMCNANAGLGASSGNSYGNFRIVNSGGSKIGYAGRMTSSANNFLSLNSSITPVTGQKYLLQISARPTETVLEVDGVTEATNPDTGKFFGIIDVLPSAAACKVDIGGIQSTSFIYGNSGKVYEMIGYQSYDATAYADVETYLKTKYGIV